MDRLNQQHATSRVELPLSMTRGNAVQPDVVFNRTFSPMTSFFIGVVSFLGCGLGIVGVAGLIALQIN